MLLFNMRVQTGVNVIVSYESIVKQYSTRASGVGKGYSHEWCPTVATRPSGAGNNTRGNISYLPHSHEYYIAFIKQFYSQPINIYTRSYLFKNVYFAIVSPQQKNCSIVNVFWNYKNFELTVIASTCYRMFHRRVINY